MSIMEGKMEELSHAIDVVLSLKHFEPSPETTSAISALLKASGNKTDSSSSDLSEDIIAHDVRDALAIALYEREKLLAKKIIESSNPLKTLQEFTLYDDYVKRVESDVRVLKAQGLLPSDGLKVLIVGSGCLNVTALIYHETKDLRGSEIYNLDICPQAISISQELNKALGVPSASQKDFYIQGDGATVELAGNVGLFDLIIIAVLAGKNEEEKQCIIDNLLPRLHDEGLILMRCCESGILLPHIPAENLKRVEVVEENCCRPGEPNPARHTIVYRKLKCQ